MTIFKDWVNPEVAKNNNNKNFWKKTIKQGLGFLSGVAIAGYSYKFLDKNNFQIYAYPLLTKSLQIGFSIGLGVVGGFGIGATLIKYRFNKFSKNAPKILSALGGAIALANSYNNNFPVQRSFLNILSSSCIGYTYGRALKKLLEVDDYKDCKLTSRER